MKIIKPDNLGLLFSPCMIGDNCCLSVAAMACFSLETALDDRLLEEAQMWQVVAGELGEEEALDLGYPKKRGEFLVYGAGHSPQAVTGLQVSVTVAGLTKTLNVSGARYWNAAGLPSTPEPFKETRISWANAFGGEGWEINPTGVGMLPDQDGRIPLPQVQDPRHLVTSPKDRPEPAGFNALNSFWPQRKRLLGTFDDTWLKKRWPHYPTDTDPEYFNSAPVDQRIAGFFKGDELLRIVNMHPEKAEIASVLPGLRARLFLNRLVDGKERFTEIEARPETVWLFPGADCGVLLFRGVAQVTDETLDDVAHLMAEWEPLNAPPETLDFYRQKFSDTIAPPEAEPLEPPAAPEPPPPAATPLAPPELPQPPEPPPLSPEAEKMMADLNDKIAQANAQADAVFARLGMTREQAMAKVMPKPEPTVAPSQLEMEKMIADAHQQADAVFAKLGLSKEEALKKYVSPQAAPKDPQQEIKALTAALQSVEARLKKSGINIQEAAAKILPDIDPASLDFGTIIAGLTSMAAALPTAGEAAAPAPPEEETEPVAPPVADQAEETLDSVDAVVKRHAQGKKLCGFDLSGLDFSGRDLAQADFSGSILANTTFTTAILTGAQFTNAVLADADFSEARMAQANMTKVQAVGATFALAELQGADLSEGDFTGCNFDGADLGTACLSGALFAEASLKECKAGGATAVRTNFFKADLTGANLHRAVITAADFSNATLDRACLSETDACQATFDGVQGTGVNFSNATLVASRASKETDLVDAIFTGTDLSRSCWERACLSGARMAGTILDAADFSRVVLDRVYLVNATAREANFMKAVMTSCDLRGVNFFKASFRHARLSQCDLKQANMFGADLYGAKIVESDIQGTDFRRAQARSAE